MISVFHWALKSSKIAINSWAHWESFPENWPNLWNTCLREESMVIHFNMLKTITDFFFIIPFYDAFFSINHCWPCVLSCHSFPHLYRLNKWNRRNKWKRVAYCRKTFIETHREKIAEEICSRTTSFTICFSNWKTTYEVHSKQQSSPLWEVLLNLASVFQTQSTFFSSWALESKHLGSQIHNQSFMSLWYCSISFSDQLN